MTDGDAVVPVARRQQARSSLTKQKILDATVASLARRGLAATTTLQIQEDAGVSRGRLLHHYPSRQQLLVAAVQHLADHRFRALRGEATSLAGSARVTRAIELLWQTYDGDLFWAAMALWMGSRGDPELAGILAVEERRLGHVVRDLCDELFGEELAAHRRYAGVRDILISAMRGVALVYSFDRTRLMTAEPQLETWAAFACRELGVQD